MMFQEREPYTWSFWAGEGLGPTLRPVLPQLNQKIFSSVIRARNKKVNLFEKSHIQATLFPEKIQNIGDMAEAQLAMPTAGR